MFKYTSISDARQMDENRKSFEEAVSSPPPALPPRLIKLTPPTPPAQTGHEDNTSYCERFQGVSQGFEQGIASKDSPSVVNPSEINQERGVNNEIILCERDETGWKASSQNPSVLDCDVTITEFMFPSALNPKTEKGTYGSELRSDALRTSLKLSDTEVDANDGANYRSSIESSPHSLWDYQREHGGNNVFSGQKVQTSVNEPNLRTGGQVDELSLLLSELDRINSSPLHEDISKSNHRPASEEVKVCTHREIHNSIAVQNYFLRKFLAL
jgi:hypothetical protein